MEPAENTLISTLEFADELHKIILEEKKKLPYHLNVIDELHINENGHSRILHKLLCFKNDKDNFEFLESFVSYLQEHTHSKEFNRIKVQHPEITQEEERIDLWVRDDNYAIILENKACYAQDQHEQIARYIDKTLETKNNRYKEEDIFIIYLPPTNEKEPAEQSWGKYKESFSDRYVNLSFKDDIIPWLEKDVLPNIRQKDVYLQSAISQYVDFLRGLFQIRTIDNNMNEIKQNEVAKYLNLGHAKDEQEEYEIIRRKLSDIKDLNNELIKLQDKTIKRIYDNWRGELEKNYKEIFDAYKALKINQYDEIVGVAININGHLLVIRIYIYSSNNSYYCQVGYGEEDMEETIFNELKNIFPPKPNCKYELFKAFSYSTDTDFIFFDNLFKFFKSVITKCLELKQEIEVS